MTITRFAIASVGAFIFISLYEMLVHVFLMADFYHQTASVWRSPEESSMPIMLLSQGLFAAALAFFYPIVGLDNECKKGLPFGFGLGLVMAMPQIGTYSYLPIPLTLSLLWAAIVFVEVICASFIISKIYNWE